MNLEDLSMAANPTLAHPQSTSNVTPNVWQMYSRWVRAYQLRRELDRLEDYLLLDIGLDPVEARAEAAKPFWAPFTLKRRFDPRQD
jgi:uncharacterized protein YjiS (DUF1127 family)